MILISGKASGGTDGNHLEHTVNQRFCMAGEQTFVIKIARGNGKKNQHEGQIGFEFGIEQITAQAARAPGAKVKCEVNAGEKHENGSHDLNHRLVDKISHIAIVSGKTTNSDSRETVRQRIEGAHAGHPVAETTGNGQGQVNKPE